jgi:hypothetical protein
MFMNSQIKIERISLAIGLISIVTSVCWWQQFAGANPIARSSKSIKLQQINNGDVKIDGATCDFVDKQQRSLLTITGADEAWVKIDGRIVKLRATKSANRTLYRSATFTIAIADSPGVLSKDGITTSAKTSLELSYNGRKLRIPGTKYCIC